MVALPPADLTGFPWTVVNAGTSLYRIVRHRDVSGDVRAGWHFSSAGDDHAGRFSLPKPDGTCHFSNLKYGGWLEVFRGCTLVDRADVDKRRLFTATRTGFPLRFGSLVSARAVSYGVTLDLAAGNSYEQAQTWAAALHAAGRSGVVGLIRHDSAGKAHNVAVFGRSGPERRVAGWRTGTTEPVRHPDLLADLRRMGIGVLDRPYDVTVTPVR